MPRVFIGPKGYWYTYMMPCWVPILMEVIGNNLYEPRDNSSFALETDVRFDWTIRTECASPSGDGFARGGEIVRCGCQARALSRVELLRSGVQKMGEGDH
ncbi:hypothetical protein IEQ34_000080 [Dendrobium chrysotoxum]|uniref:Uncharacterized protein n=1 Tax=Dendrobium chrysotoxum TaxID=161865 RepID=A0AAV7HRS3_DENCH|nr:hypothetical protein IEQ34_000080 [Dendrobium chrysotoxum]